MKQKKDATFITPCSEVSHYPTT